MLGSPIAHSKSPAIQRAAFGVLGLDWEYGMAEVTGEALPDYIAGLDDRWRGLSLTMPLKRDVLPLLDGSEPLVAVVGAANTVRFTDDGMLGASTDVYGVEQAFREAGVDRAGARARPRIGRDRRSRDRGGRRAGVADGSWCGREPPSTPSPWSAVGEAVGVEVTVRSLAVEDRSLVVPDAIVSTLPGHAEHGLVFPEAVRSGAVLFDVAYDPWPSALARVWSGARDIGAGPAHPPGRRPAALLAARRQRARARPRA